MLASVISLFCLIASAVASDVVVLTNANFEAETQAATGATTGDWLIKFYAPWCGHCKTLAPIYDQVATDLKGEINVGKIDVTANRELGVRFDIKGFPTLKFLHKGEVFNFQGRRSAEEIADFARGGYKMHTGTATPKQLGYFGEITKVFTHAYDEAVVDLKAGRYFTENVVLVSLPCVLMLLIVGILLMPPVEDPRPKGKRSPAQPKEE